MTNQISNTGISLTKDAKMDITKTNPGLKTVGIGAGWDAADQNSQKVDVDLFVVRLDANNKLLTTSNNEQEALKSVTFYGNMKSEDGAIELDKDNLDGVGDGDDETVRITFDQLDSRTEAVGIFVNIYDAVARGQKFGGVKNAFVRIYNADTKEELGRYDLAEEASNNTGYLMGKLYRHSGEWKFTSASQGINGTIPEIIAQFN